jgi:hypothetical protein
MHLHPLAGALPGAADSSRQRRPADALADESLQQAKAGLDCLAFLLLKLSGRRTIDVADPGL